MLRWTAIVTAALMGLAAATPRKILVLGDSQSEEYDYEVTFSAPASDPAEANIHNWIEILASRRPGEVYFGAYAPNVFSYSDWRNAGFAFNWGVPGFKTTDFVEVIRQISPAFSGDALLDYLSRRQIIDQLQDDVEYAVVFLGGNDVNNRYMDFYYGTVPASFLTGVVANLKEIIDFIQAANPAVRIVVVNIPDPGVTPDVIADHPDAGMRAAASARLASLNQSIAALVAGENAALADVFALTEWMRQTGAPVINGTYFARAGHEENSPGYLFARDGFHPSTAPQALFANVILQAINTRYGQAIPLLPNREILGSVLGLDPDQPVRDWLAALGMAGQSPDSDSDGDGLPHWAEFGLGTDPGRFDGSASAALLEESEAGRQLVLRWFPANTQGGYVVFGAEEGGDPLHWTPVALSRTRWTPDGAFEAWRPASGSAGFLRLTVQPAP